MKAARVWQKAAETGTYASLLFEINYLSQWESKSTTKNFLQTNRVEKLNQKPTKLQNRFFLHFFNHVFGRFSVRGVQKHNRSIGKTYLTLVLFFGLCPTNPPVLKLPPPPRKYNEIKYNTSSIKIASQSR
jgi:hypothetical protein